MTKGIVMLVVAFWLQKGRYTISTIRYIYIYIYIGYKNVKQTDAVAAVAI